MKNNTAIILRNSLVYWLLVLVSAASSAEITYRVSVSIEPQSKGIKQGIVYFVPQNRQQLAHSKADHSALIVSQTNSQFDPYISVVQLGQTVKFPNKDSFSHHVYSFSKAKVFELPLYTAKEIPEVIFDKAGVVTIGCNIHDWMISYLLVVDTPYFYSASDSNLLVELPKNEYEVFYWHPRLGEKPIKHPETISITAETSIKFEINKKIKYLEQPTSDSSQEYNRY